jgi:hypothetical protein
MWPSEGSVSDEAVAMIADAGFHWIATDEDILARSLNVPIANRPDLLYRPYRVGEGGPVALFRDHAMSDRIGFTYQSWDPVAAANDFVGHVREAGRRFSAAAGGEVGTVSVILDGENAWEYYDGGGRPFLRALYRALSEADDIETVTMSQAAAGPAAVLPSIFPGSWINGDFYIWIGHRDDHRAWDQLSEARGVFDQRADLVPAEARDRALEELLIAQGSDWFWWYGDDHSSDHDADFDDLFRRHLRNAYAALGAAVPEALFATNISTGAGPDRLEPSGSLAITLDGRETSFLEWEGSVAPALSRPAGSMHEVSASPLISEVRVGLAAHALCLRLAGVQLVASAASGAASVALVLAGAEVRVLLVEGPWMALGSIIEIEIPFDRIAAAPGGDLQFAIQIRDQSGAILEAVPQGRFWTVVLPDAAAIRSDWQV